MSFKQWLELQRAEFNAGYKEGRVKGYSLPGYQKAIMMSIAIVLIACVVFLSNPGSAYCISPDVNTIFPVNPQGLNIPRIPHTVSGCAMIGEYYVPDGTIISVLGTNESLITHNGCFGGTGTFDEKLILNGFHDGDMIQFLINGEPCRIRETNLFFINWHSGFHSVITLVAYDGCSK